MAVNARCGYSGKYGRECAGMNDMLRALSRLGYELDDNRARTMMAGCSRRYLSLAMGGAFDVRSDCDVPVVGAAVGCA